MVVSFTYKTSKVRKGKDNPILECIIKGKDFTKLGVKKYVQKVMDKFRGKNMMFQITVETGKGSRSSKEFSIDDDIETVEDYDWETTPYIIVWMWKGKPQENGTDDDNNDCLFNCISKILNNYNLPKELKTPDKLKLALNLNRDDKIPFSDLGKVEKLFGVNIYMGNDYISKGKYNHNIYLVSNDGHCDIEDKNNRKPTYLLNTVPSKNQKLIFAELGTDNVKCYDGETIYSLSVKEYIKQKNKLFEDYAFVEDKIENYDEFVKEVEKLKKLSKGKYDLSKSGYKPTNEALKTIHFSLLPFKEPEPIGIQEEGIIHETFKGGLIFGEEIELENAYQYDVRSHYPSILCDSHFTFPVKQGKFSQIKKFDEFIKYGIYHCNISKSNDRHINKLFRFNEKNYYTHYDINLAKYIGLEVELIMDDEPNALLYNTGRANGKQYFGECINSLYALKEKGCKLAKDTINSMWGVLASRNKITKTTLKGEITIGYDDKFTDIIPLRDGDYKIRYVKQNQYFKYPYARLGVFLTSRARAKIAMELFPVRENIFRTHTDGFISNILLSHISVSNKIGDYKLEMTGKCKIMNCNNVRWMDENGEYQKLKDI